MSLALAGSVPEQMLAEAIRTYLVVQWGHYFTDFVIHRDLLE
jgi:hypothetical protein